VKGSAHTAVQNMKENHFRFETSVGFLSNCRDEEVRRPKISQATDTSELSRVGVGEQLH